MCRMEKCFLCGAPTKLFLQGDPICIACDKKREEKKTTSAPLLAKQADTHQ